jgi:hypothetical protein
MPLSAETWPIALALLRFTAIARDGSSAHDAEPEAWGNAFRQVSRAGSCGVVDRGSADVADRGGRGTPRRHVPNFLTKTRTGFLVVDVKPAEFAAKPEIRAVFEWTRAICQEAGLV